MKLKIMAIIFGFLVIFAHNARAYEFLPPQNVNLVIEFEEETQAGKEIHKLEIRQLGYKVTGQNIKTPTAVYYLIYYAGEQYGPEIVAKLDGHTPFLKLNKDKTVDIEFTRGNSDHILQVWTLIGHTAKMREEKAITWKERRYFKK